MDDGSVLVHVVADVEDRRQIRWNVNVAESLEDRVDDVRRAVTTSASAVANSLPALAAAEGWQLSEVSATFGISLTAEAGVIISKAEAGATFEVGVTFTRE
jgi:Trypsin-co-occurring domain 1